AASGHNHARSGAIDRAHVLVTRALAVRATGMARSIAPLPPELRRPGLASETPAPPGRRTIPEFGRYRSGIPLGEGRDVGAPGGLSAHAFTPGARRGGGA